MTAFVTAAAAVGALVGGRLVTFVNPDSLRTTFGWFVLFMGSLILTEEVDPIVGAGTAVLTLAAAGISIACLRFGHCPLRRIVRRGPVSAAAA